jgi:hypothetical protein
VPEEAPEAVIQFGDPETAQVQEAMVWMLTAALLPEAGACNAVDDTE